MILEYVRKYRDQDGWRAQHRRDCSKGTSSTRQNNDSGTNECCEEVRIVKGDEAPLGGVAQVLMHGVRVVEVSLQVREHE